MKIDKQWVEKINQLKFKNDVAIVEHSNFTFTVKRIADLYNINNRFNFSIMVYKNKQNKYHIENFTYNELTFFYIEIVDNSLLNLIYKDGNEIIGITYKILNDSIIDFKRIYENKEVIFDKPLSFTVEQAKNLFVFETSNNEFNEFYYNLNGKVLYKVLKDKSGSRLKQVNYFNNLDDIKVIRYFKNNYLSRDDGPAIIKYSKEGEILEKHFYKDGTYVSSSKCPGYIEYDDDNGKAVTSFFYDKVVFNRKNFPATYEFEFQKEKCTYTCVCWFKNGKLHNDSGPAKIIIDHEKVVKEFFYLNGDSIVDELAIELIRIRENEIVKKIRKNLVKLCKIEEV